jgi:FkbM family methyltransferase
MGDFSFTVGRRDPTQQHKGFRNKIRIVTRFVRHKTFLRRFSRIWDIARKPYHAVFDLFGGVPIVVGGGATTINIPAKFSGADIEDYEVQSVAKLAQWCRAYPAGCFIDVGCSYGLFDAVALAAGISKIVAIDSDIPSLKQAELFTGHYRSDSMALVWGLVGSHHGSEWSLQDAIVQTQKKISLSGATGDVGTTRYVCMENDPDGLIPRHSIDGLFANQNLPIPCCLKCDVEGGEFELLQGAQAFLENYKPTILLSVHFHIGEQQIAAIRRFLGHRGYRIEMLAQDHEQHWWCTTSMSAELS